MYEPGTLVHVEFIGGYWDGRVVKMHTPLSPRYIIPLPQTIPTIGATIPEPHEMRVPVEEYELQRYVDGTGIASYVCRLVG